MAAALCSVSSNSRSGTLPAIQIVRRRKKKSLNVRARAVLAEQVVRKDLRSAGMEIRMVVSDYEDAHGQRLTRAYRQ